MQKINARKDLFNIQMGISATPTITFVQAGNKQQTVYGLSELPNANGFCVKLEAALPYESLAQVVNGYLAGKRFQLTKGLINKYMVVQHCNIGYSTAYQKMVVAVDFSGSHKGTLYFTCIPKVDATREHLLFEEFNYNLETNDILLKAARWLFDKQIVVEIKKYLVFDLSPYYASISKTIHSWINKQWSKGVGASGQVTGVHLTGVHAAEHDLQIAFTCAGSLSLLITEINIHL